MHALEIIVAKNERAAKLQRDRKHKARPQYLSRKANREQERWPEYKPGKTPPHGDPLTAARKVGKAPEPSRLSALEDAAQRVLDTWEHGDLAAAVRALDAVLNGDI